MNEPIGRCGSLSPALVRRIALEMAVDGLFLTNHPLGQFILHAEQLLRFLLLKLEERNAGHLGDDDSDILFFELDSLFIALLFPIAFHLLKLFFLELDRIAQAGRLSRIPDS